MPAHQPLDAETLEAFDQAQRKTFRILADGVAQLREGQSEKDVEESLRNIAGDYGFTEWFHPPHARFGGPVSWPSRARSRAVLTPGTLVELDVGPATDQAYGDGGVALAFGAAEPAEVASARELCRATCGFASRWKTVGELYVYARAWANNRRLSLGDAKAVGHVCLGREGLIDSLWPQGARAATVLRRNQIQYYNPRRLLGLYAVRPRLVVGDVALAFEEMIYVDGDVRRIIGRDSIDQIGTL